MIPVCTANVLGLIFNTYCLQMVDASYFQVARGLNLPFTVFFQCLAAKILPAKGILLSCMFVSWGFMYTYLPPPFGSNVSTASIVAVIDTAAEESNQDIEVYTGEAPALGMFLGVLSAIMIAIHCVLIGSALKTVNGKALVVAYWSNVLSTLALIPCIVYMGEVPEAVRTFTGQTGSLGAFLGGTTLTVSS